MKGPLLLLFVLLALMAAFAGAEAPPEESLVEKVQLYVQQAAQKAQEHLATIRESPATQQAKEWVEAGVAQMQQFMGSWKDQMTSLWEKATANA